MLTHSPSMATASHCQSIDARATSFLLAPLLALVACRVAGVIAGEAPLPFVISVVDEATGRGVPLVELRTTNDVLYVTDSAGVAAVTEPALVDQAVYFHVRSHGYEYPADGFGYRGKALRVTSGEKATLKLKRTNIAERLYRVTGADIYRDSVLAGREAPIDRPLINAQVTGSDSVNAVVYRQQVHWFWGDTNRLGYPLGAFHVPGAVSQMPADGGLAIDRGVNLQYFTRDDGFAANTCQMPGDGPTWIDGVCVATDSSGQEQLFAAYMKVRKFLEVYERGLVRWNDQRKQFERVAAFESDAPVYPHGQATKIKHNGVDYIYFGNPHPTVRVRAEADLLADLDQYEAFTCLAPGSTLEKPQFDRNEQGAVRWSWKRNAAAPRASDLFQWIDRGLLDKGQAILGLVDMETGQRVIAHAGNVAWNEYRQGYVMICTQVGGASYLGEVWFAEADTPLGPWVYARKIVTHDKYSFYNPCHHAMFDQDGGRRIFFEGTYSKTFSGNDVPTPRYDYNQIMYGLDLAASRLNLPACVYQAEIEGARQFSFGATKPSNAGTITFMALDRPRDGALAIVRQATAEGDGALLALPASGQFPHGAQVLFHALPADAANDAKNTVPLFEWKHVSNGQRRYLVGDDSPGKEYQRAEAPLSRVWRYPLATSLRFE